jgi:hypothetical protein
MPVTKTACTFTCEEERGADEFGGFSETCQGRMAQNHLSAGRGGSIFIEEQTAVLLAGEKAGRDGIDPNVVRRPFSRRQKVASGKVICSGFLMRKIKGLRWWIVGLICLGTIINYLARNSLAVLAPELQKQLHFSTQQYSYIVAAFQIGYTVMQSICGFALDFLGLKFGFALFAVA